MGRRTHTIKSNAKHAGFPFWGGGVQHPSWVLEAAAGSGPQAFVLLVVRPGICPSPAPSLTVHLPVAEGPSGTFHRRECVCWGKRASTGKPSL